MDRISVVWLPTEELIPYEKNAKKHSEEQVQYIANSIEEFGWRQPLVIDNNYVIVIGHGRWLAAKKLKLDSVPCIIANELSDKQIRILRLADNKTAESDWDEAMLEFELADFVDDYMSKFGFLLTDELETDYEEYFADAHSKPAKEIECPNCGQRFEV